MAFVGAVRFSGGILRSRLGGRLTAVTAAATPVTFRENMRGRRRERIFSLCRAELTGLASRLSEFRTFQRLRKNAREQHPAARAAADMARRRRQSFRQPLVRDLLPFFPGWRGPPEKRHPQDGR